LLQESEHVGHGRGLMFQRSNTVCCNLVFQ